MNQNFYPSLKAALTGCFGSGVVVTRSERLSGGDINDARCLKLSSGEELFVKSNTSANRAFFEAEEQGLRAIAATDTIGTPRVLARGVDGDTSFLMLEMVRGGPRNSRFWERFGQQLSALHSADTSGLVPGFGFPADNFIGAAPQHNSPRERWVDFFRVCRLTPQLAMARHWFDARTLERFERLLSRLEILLPEPEAPSLLHGDLWSGNFLVGPDGLAWLIDPAAYVGHAEADLAMSELFGGFSPTFYAAYREANPLEPGYRERRDLYNLYHLLNHLNLFGGGYLGAVLETLRRCV